MRHPLKKFAILALAALFMLEAWLWDVTGAAIRHVLGWIPYQRLKLWVAARVEHLSPWLTLGVFIIPALVLLPLKFLTLLLFAEGHVLSGIGMALFAKLAGLGVSSFLFTLCKPKLMELRFIRWLYTHCIYWRDRAHVLLAPYKAQLREGMASLRALLPRGKGLEKLRARMHSLRRKQRGNP